LTCAWTFEAPTNNHRIVLTVGFFQTEAEYDFVYIGEGVEVGEDTLAELTGYIRPGHRYISSGNELWVAFESDESVKDEGFFLNVSAIHKNHVDECDDGNQILSDDFCDGVIHCEDLSDETDCDCDDDAFVCDTNICIDPDNVCDQKNDCADFSDENNCPGCRRITHDKCLERLSYKKSYFPNHFVESQRKAKRWYRINRRFAGCHEHFAAMTCSVLFPECTDSGPVARMCKSVCHEIEESCRHLWEYAMPDMEWELDCEMFSDEGDDGDGFCSGPEGDVSGTGECGVRALFDDRVVGGVDAEAGEWPFIGSLRDRRDNHVCGATLIHPRWAVTAAHCVGYFDKIVFGDYELSEESNHHFSVEFDDIISHGEYDGWTNDNDIALLRLQEDVPMGDYIAPACLAMSRNEKQAYRNCHVAGWGTTEEGGDIAETLQEAVVQFVDEWDCQWSYEYSLTHAMVCAGYMEGGIDTCQGDSGGPLICEGGDGRWHLAGVTSFGDGCARAGFPGVYARVSVLQHWIRDVMSDFDD